MANKAVDVLARTLWGEARGEGQIGMEAVANVVMNRVAHRSRWPKEVDAVCLQAWQFSAWNNNDPNRKKMLALTKKDKIFLSALAIAQTAVEGTLADRTGGADHYHERSIKPYWARGSKPTARIGRHIFYRLE